MPSMSGGSLGKHYRPITSTAGTAAVAPRNDGFALISKHASALDRNRWLAINTLGQRLDKCHHLGIDSHGFAAGVELVGHGDLLADRGEQSLATLEVRDALPLK